MCAFCHDTAVSDIAMIGKRFSLFFRKIFTLKMIYFFLYFPHNFKNVIKWVLFSDVLLCSYYPLCPQNESITRTAAVAVLL